jgi:IS30 family transposase
MLPLGVSFNSHSKCNNLANKQPVVTSCKNRQVQQEEQMKYHQLSEVDRYQIDAGIALGMKLSEIAKRMGRSRSTLFRELKRNGHISREGYSAFYSRQQYDARREKCRPKFKIQGEIKKWIDARIKHQWSPEQIVGRAKLEDRSLVGVETIYRYIYRDKKQGGELWKNLRHTRGKRKKRFKANRWPSLIPRPSIENRPIEATNRTRQGDFERDLIVGLNRGGYLLTLADRKTRLVKIRKIHRPTAKLVHNATLHSLKGINVLSLTNDNGCEFVRYAETSKKLNVPIFFTRPYASWERGTIENMNKLIRQYFPKKTKLEEISDEEIKMVEMVLNDRPRKTLGYNTPNEAMVR